MTRFRHDQNADLRFTIAMVALLTCMFSGLFLTFYLVDYGVGLWLVLICVAGSSISGWVAFWVILLKTGG